MIVYNGKPVGDDEDVHLPPDVQQGVEDALRRLDSSSRTEGGRLRDSLVQSQPPTVGWPTPAARELARLAAEARFNSPEARSARNTQALLAVATDQAALLANVVVETQTVSAKVVELTDKVGELEREASAVDALRHRQLIVVAMIAVLFGFLLSHFFG